MRFILIIFLLLCAGCSYWPQTAKPAYYEDSAREVKEDIDDITGARTL